MLSVFGFADSSGRRSGTTLHLGALVAVLAFTACDTTTFELDLVSAIEVHGVPELVESGQALAVTVVLLGADGLPVDEHPVRFETDDPIDVEAGVSDAEGTVRLTWTPTEVDGPHRLFVRSGSQGVEVVTQVMVAADPVVPPGSFSIELVGTSLAPEVRDAVDAAMARWTSVIRGELSDEALDVAANACGIEHPAVRQTVDDLALIVDVRSFDGPGRALASAGPCVLRRSDRLPVLGVVRIDADDVPDLIERGALENVLIHEIGHALGLGSLWVGKGQTSGLGTEDPLHIGEQAVGHFRALGGQGTGVPLENFGATGTRDVHWRESVLKQEVMTGWLTPGALNPLSTITIGALEDLGYVVDYGAADTFAGVAPKQSQGKLAKTGEAAADFTVDLRLLESALPAPTVLGR